MSDEKQQAVDRVLGISDSNSDMPGWTSGMNPAPVDWLDTLASEHSYHERRYNSLDKRVKALESRGTFMPNIDEENIMFWLTGAYVLFAYVLPAVFRLFEKPSE